MILCYCGDHSKCDNTRIGRRSLFCTKNSRWHERSLHMSAQRLTSMKLNINDLMKVRSVIEMKLGLENIGYFQFMATTSKNEAVNRAIKHSLPSNMTFARTGRGRAHSAVLKCNNGLFKSTAIKLNRLHCSFPQVTQKILKKYVRRQENKVRIRLAGSPPSLRSPFLAPSFLLPILL